MSPKNTEPRMCTQPYRDHLHIMPHFVLQVHGEAIMREAGLRERAAGLEKRLHGTWSRLEALLQGARCMVAFFGNWQS